MTNRLEEVLVYVKEFLKNLQDGLYFLSNSNVAT